ncbi:MAG: hypothetical protein R2715_23180 [Ilumatobacteraceae bacterium]
MLIIGVGGLGHLGVQFVKATTAAKVIAVDSKQSASGWPPRAADHTLLSSDDTATAVRDLTGERSGRRVGLRRCRVHDPARPGCSAVTADVTIVGIAGGSVTWNFFSQPYEVNLTTTYWGSRPELVELLELAGRGVVRADFTTYSLDDAAQAYRDLAAGTVAGRAVIVP